MTRVGLSFWFDPGCSQSLLAGILRVADALGWDLVHLRENWSGSSGPEVPLDGIIGYSIGYSPQPPMPPWSAVPFIDLDDPVHGLLIDERAVGACAAEHLLDQGLHHLASVAWCGPGVTQQRLLGFQEAAGRTCTVLPPVAGVDVKGRKQIAAALTQMPRPFGLFCTSDWLGVMALEACADVGLAVPAEASVVGVDDDLRLCAFTRPALSSVIMPHTQLGTAAARRLAERLAGSASAGYPPFPPGPVTVRRSSNLLHCADPAVAAAIALIRSGYALDLTVAGIAARVGLGRRSLERRFQAARGHGIHAELHRLRMRKARTLLQDPALHVGAVAAAVGLGRSRFCESFTRETGMTPSAWQRLGRWPGPDSPLDTP